MPQKNINSWLEEELYQQYLNDRAAVDESWKRLFEQGVPDGGNPAPAPAAAPAPPAPVPERDGELVPLRGAAARIAQNMAASAAIPLATSQRTVPVKVMDENRRIMNQHLTLVGRNKVSYTHLIAWAIVKAVAAHSVLNSAYSEEGGGSRVIHREINIGLAVDVPGKDGARSLLVPNIKNAGALDFEQFITAFDDLVARARAGRLTPADFQGTTISYTNPGTVGTMASNPRLLPGQGAIIATGAIDYPAERSVFPPELPAPTWLWRDGAGQANSWQIDITFSDGSPPIRALSAGERMGIGKSDPRCAAPTKAECEALRDLTDGGC
jgi:2-oxoglutarate dehydrogenase E1 component